jgi:hypothetical protein
VVVPTGIEKIDRRAYLTAGAMAESAESAIEFGRRLQRHQIAGLKNRGVVFYPPPPLPKVRLILLTFVHPHSKKRTISLCYAEIPSGGFQHNATLLHAGRQVGMPSVSASSKSPISKVFSRDSIFIGTGLVGPTYHPPFHMCTPESTCCNEAMIVFRSTSPRTAPFFVPDEVFANHSSSFARILQQLPRLM